MSEITRKSIFGSSKEKELETEKIVKSEVVEMDIEKLISYKGSQPFSKLSDSKRTELLNSIERNGIMEAIIVRPCEDEKYEILAGHNRVDCCKELGKETILAKIVEADDDLAEFIMLETNLCRREELSPIEKGKAYKQQLYLIMKRRNTDAQVGHLSSIAELAGLSEDSRTQIQRYIRLTSLIPELQQKVENKTLPLVAGVELSYIDEEEQRRIYQILEMGSMILSIEKAEDLRSRKGTLDEEEILKVLIGEAPKVKPKIEFKFTGKLKKKTLNKYRDKFNDNNEFNDLVEKLLDEYFSNQE